MEALVRTRDNLADSTANIWDVIAIKPKGAVWGKKERKVHQLIRIDTGAMTPIGSAAIKDQLQSAANALAISVQPLPVIAYPFAIYTDSVLTRASDIYFDLDQLPAAQVDRIKDQEIFEPAIDFADIRSHALQRA